MATNGLNSLTIPQLKALAGSGGFPVPSSIKTKSQILIYVKSRMSGNNNGKMANLKRIDPSNNEIVKDIFLNKETENNPGREATNDAKQVADELVEDPETNASNFMTSFMKPEDIESFKKAWKNLAAQQVLNGSFLEFQGMRFVDGNAQVYDAKRDNSSEGLDVFRHIMQQTPQIRLYLKSKFKLEKVNSDNTPILTGGPKWADVYDKAKGKVDCEPDLIVRLPGAIHIYELKMGKGKSETSTEPREYLQLLRARHLFEKFLALPEFAGVQKPKIKLYFVGWSAKTDAMVDFGRPVWHDRLSPESRVVKVNADGMLNSGCPINHSLVTKIISVLNVQRSIAYYLALRTYFEPWGGGRQEFNRWANKALSTIREQTKNGRYNTALEKPPYPVTTRSQAKKARENQAKTEERLRSMARVPVNLARAAGAPGAPKSAASLFPSYKGPRGRTFTRSSPNNLRFCQEAMSHGARTSARCQALLGASPSVRQNIANTLALQQRGINNNIILAVMANSNNFDRAYNNFLSAHAGVSQPNRTRKLIEVLENPPSNSRRANFASKLAHVKARAKRQTGRSAAAAV